MEVAQSVDTEMLLARIMELETENTELSRETTRLDGLVTGMTRRHAAEIRELDQTIIALALDAEELESMIDHLHEEVALEREEVEALSEECELLADGLRDMGVEIYEDEVH